MQAQPTPYILAVDDEPDVQQLVRVFLRDVDIEVVCTGSAIEALRAVRSRGRPVVAIVDVAMPDLSGLDLVRVLRGRTETATLPVVFLSARVHPSDLVAGQALDATYLKKPCMREDLLRVVDGLMRASVAGSSGSPRSHPS